MRRYFIIAGVVIAVLLLVLCFSPSGSEATELYDMYQETSNMDTAVDLSNVIQKAKENLEKVIDKKGLIVCVFPLKVDNSQTVKDGDIFSTYGNNNWRKAVTVMDNGQLRNAGVHGGSDISILKGDASNVAVVSMLDGIVTAAGYGNSNGNYVKVLNTDTGLVMAYLHMKNNSLKVKTNDKIKAGQQLGIMGNTGSSKGAHLHVGVSYAGTGDLYETVTTPDGKCKNGLDMYDVKYFAYTRGSFPKNFEQNKDRKWTINIID